MKKIMSLFINKVQLVLFFLFLSTIQMMAQQIQLSPKATVSVLTCATGNESYALFGHTALRITDPEQGLDVVYNYGAFDFSTPNFVARFAKGDLQYFVVAHSFYDFMQQYQYEGRSVYEQQLRLPQTVLQRIWDRLQMTMQTDEKYYTYKFIDKNCTTMVVDLLNQSLGSEVIRYTSAAKQSYRDILFPYFKNHFYEQLGTSVIFGTKVDQPAQTVFLPLELKAVLKTTKYQKQALSAAAITLLEVAPEVSTSWWNNIYTYGVLLLLLLFWKRKAVALTFLTFMGLMGVFFVSMGFYSLHPELAQNYNALLFNPFLLVLVITVVLKKAAPTRYLVLFHLLCLLVYTVLVSTKAPFMLLLPLIVVTATLLYRLSPFMSLKTIKNGQ